MPTNSTSRGLPIIVLSVFSFAITARAAGAPPDVPATVAAAAKAIDLSTLPLVAGTEAVPHRGVATLSYAAPGTVKKVFGFHRKQLLDGKWKELPGSYISDESSSATFARDGFTLSFSVSSAGNDGKAGVMIMNHGNVKLDKLPVPKGAKLTYGGPVVAHFTADTSVDESTEACRKLLLAAGWQPYGTAVGMQFYKQNAVRLTAFISAAPALGGKTAIQYSTEMMSADLPAPAEVEKLDYSDSPAQLYFETAISPKDLADFYRKALEKFGWKATTESLIDTDNKHELIFRNPGKEMLTLEVTEFTGKNRAVLRHLSAPDVVELDKQFAELKARKKLEQEQAAQAAKKAEKDNAPPKLSVAIPAGATEIEQTKDHLKFKLPAGKAKAAVEAYRKQFGKDGWKETTAVLENMAGSVLFNKEKQHLTLTYSDTGFLPTEVILDGMGVEFEKAAEKQ
jgi:hypothetical protein